MITVDKGTEFESNVCQILYTTNPYSISHYDGGPDRGRDILLQYKIGTMIYDVIVECKCYAQSVNKENIMSSLDWAKSTDLHYYIYGLNLNLTPSTKDYINLFCKEYGISVLFEEEL
ncbi:restriction endonuclease, partial [Roseburia sp. OM04-10AA]|uniref:restriction endonuclease n=1 Tax=Roseburia sp. OM04-10AA TaxID=2293141 RepID=UPI000FEEF7B1